MGEPRSAGASGKTPSGFGRAKACILLFMWGGPAHQDTWDLKPKAPAEIRGEFQPISTNVSGVQIGEHFPQLARRADQLAIIRSMTHGDVNHTNSSHDFHAFSAHRPAFPAWRPRSRPAKLQVGFLKSAWD